MGGLSSAGASRAADEQDIDGSDRAYPRSLLDVPAVYYGLSAESNLKGSFGGRGAGNIPILGIVKRMFAEPGAPHHTPHFHAYYQNSMGIFSVESIDLIGGDLPRKERRLVEAWAEVHQNELMENWERLQTGRLPYRIASLR